MKILMRTIIGFILMMTFFALLGRAQEKGAVKEANKSNDAKADKNIVDEDVADFLVKAADARMMDTKEGKLAIAKGTTQAIRNYGQAMVKDQALLLQKIKALADERNITLPSNLSDEKRDGYNDLAEKTGKDFDEKFVKMMTIDHKRDVKMFDDATDLNDKEVSEFARSFLPMIQSHLDSINKIKEATK